MTATCTTMRWGGRCRWSLEKGRGRGSSSTKSCEIEKCVLKATPRAQARSHDTHVEGSPLTFASSATTHAYAPFLASAPPITRGVTRLTVFVTGAGTALTRAANPRTRIVRVAAVAMLVVATLAAKNESSGGCACACACACAVLCCAKRGGGETVVLVEAQVCVGGGARTGGLL